MLRFRKHSRYYGLSALFIRESLSSVLSDTCRVSQSESRSEKVRILVVTDNYPSNSKPARGTFVYDLVQELCKQGAQLEVIAPKPLWLRDKGGVTTYGPECAQVHRPSFLPIPHRTVLPGFNTVRIAHGSFLRASHKAAAQLLQLPDVVYGHFLYPGGVSALSLAGRFQVPSVVALGEANMAVWEPRYGLKEIGKTLNQFTAIIAVSNKIREYCTQRIGIPESKVHVIPNAVDTSVFYPRDRAEMRSKLGLPRDAFIVIYVGHFIERKGHKRLLEALQRSSGAKAIFIGDGAEYPVGESVLFAGPVKHHDLPEWLAAADVFVLPTLAEGASNAVNEALAMGLPLIVSDIPEIREQVPDGCAIFVDPMNVEQIGQAIEGLRNQPENRRRMGDEALRVGSARTLSVRASRILEVLDETVTSFRSRGPVGLVRASESHGDPSRLAFGARRPRRTREESSI